MSIELGKYNTLEVVKEVAFGMYLDGGEEGEILLPSRYVPQDCKVGDKLKESYAHLCTLRDEVIEMGVLPAIKDWHSINPNID
mgnify:CR=1 FL=1